MISSDEAEMKESKNIAKGSKRYSSSHSIAYFVIVCLIGLITGVVATARGTDLLGLFIVLLGFAAIVF